MKVFIPQRPFRKEPDSEKYYNKYSLVSLKNFKGISSLHYVFDPIENFSNIEKSVKDAEYKLSDFNEDDYIVLLGSPMAIALTFSILGKKFKHLNILKWERNIGEYTKREVNL